MLNGGFADSTLRPSAYLGGLHPQGPMPIAATRLIELAEVLADTPTLSVFVSTNAARRRGGTHGVWQTEVAALTQALRCRFIDIVERGDREMFERNLRRLELRLRGLPHAARAPGWFVVVARGDVHYCAPASFPGESDARWQNGPWVSLVFAPTAFASHTTAFPLTPAHL